MPPTRVYAACYKPLPPQFARVLELHAGELSDPLVGTLVAQPIDGHGKLYEAVSYVWGGVPTKTMVVDGTPVAITASLEKALQAFRPRPDRRRRPLVVCWEIKLAAVAACGRIAFASIRTICRSACRR